MAQQRFRVELSRQATRAFQRLAPRDRSRIARALDAMELEPRPGGKRVKAIKGSRDAFLRYRVSDYRIMYEVHEEDRLILVAGIVHRSDLEAWVRRHGS